MKTFLPKRKITPYDAIPLVSVALICLILFAVFSNKPASELAEIKTSAETFTVELSKDNTYSFSSGDFEYTAEVIDGSIYLTEASCPDGTCKAMGKIGKERSGAIICVPGNLIIKTTQKAVQNDADIIRP